MGGSTVQRQVPELRPGCMLTPPSTLTRRRHPKGEGDQASPPSQAQDSLMHPVLQTFGLSSPLRSFLLPAPRSVSVKFVFLSLPSLYYCTCPHSPLLMEHSPLSPYGACLVKSQPRVSPSLVNLPTHFSVSVSKQQSRDTHTSNVLLLLQSCVTNLNRLSTLPFTLHPPHHLPCPFSSNCPGFFPTFS